MKTFTLDSNCIIDLEEGRADAVYLEELKKLWLAQKIQIAVVSASASENQVSGGASRSYAEFEAKLKRAGLDGARELLPVGIWDFGYWDHMLWSSDEIEKDINEIRDFLFPKIQHDPPVEPSENSKWRNQMCDVVIAWAHGYHKSDYFITRDRNFHQKASQLAKYGIKTIITPEGAVTIAKSA